MTKPTAAFGRTLIMSTMFALALVAPRARALPGFGVGLSAQAGTPGLGASLWFPLAGSFADVRVGFSTFSINHNFTLSNGGNHYAFQPRLRNMPILLDWYPFGSGFHLTAGAFYDDNTVSLTAQPQSGTYVIDGQPYPASELGVITGTVRYARFAPYLGLGFGDPFSGVFPLFVSFDLGAYYQGAPDVNLVSSQEQSNAAVASSLAAEASSLRADIGKYRWFPVINLGLGVAF